LTAISFQRSAFGKKQTSPTPEEAAAIVAALESLDGEQEDATSLGRSRWRLAGLLGHEVEPGMKLEGSLWSYSRWEGSA
jgi:predicted DNA-binding transcriptional regulator YafY